VRRLSRKRLFSVTESVWQEHYYSAIKEFAEIIKGEGIDAGFDAFVKFHNEDALFRRNCHDVTHYIGSIAYREFQVSEKIITRGETSFCGFGFYHGFIESALADMGAVYYKEGRKYCESLLENPVFKERSERNNAFGACVHGFGHAIFDSIEGEYWSNDIAMVERALNLCELTFDENNALESCASGVFNSLAIAYTNHSYDLNFDLSDPTNICHRQKELYRNRCYMEVGIHYVRDQNLSREKTLSFIDELRNRKASSAMILAYTDDEIRRSTTTPEIVEIKKFCNSFQLRSDKQSCIKGAIIGLRSSGTPGKEDLRIREFCSYFRTETQCFRYFK